MYSRPKPDETDEDILALQAQFLKQREEKTVDPAAKVIFEEKPQASSTADALPADPQVQIANTFEVIPSNICIGKIVEKKTGPVTNIANIKFHSEGFPQANQRERCSVYKREGGSIFAQQMKRTKTVVEPMETNTFEAGTSKSNTNLKESSSRSITNAVSSKVNIPTQSYVVTSEVKDAIHKENVDMLQKMTEQEIIEEREKLIMTMDPAIVAFLKSRRQHAPTEHKTPDIEAQNKAADDMNIEDIETSAEIISNPNADRWLNFDTVEMNKLAWMKNADVPKINKDQPYEARFDFEGWLLPFSEPDVTEKTRILYHHGDEPNRPGYTLQELFQLSRSSVIQQKVVSLNTIANILSLEQSGVYDATIDLPLEQIFFVVRFCLDDNTPAVLNASIKAMRNLFFYPIDETCLDNLLGFGLGLIQPTLAIDSNETEDDKTVNDQQLAETNLIRCLARTDILVRIRYIINVVKPATETIVYCIEILTRLVRDSPFITDSVYKTPDLIGSVIKNFVPKYMETSEYGQPLVQAVKFLRIFAAKNKNIASVLIKRYNVMESLVTYLSNDSISASSTGLKLQTETFHLWCIFIHFGLALDYVRQLQPVLLRMLDYHIRNTNSTTATSYVLQSHAASLLNLVTRVATIHYTTASPFFPRLVDPGLLKWASQFSTSQEYTCGKLQIITSVIKCVTSLYKFKSVNDPVQTTMMEEAVLKMLKSKGFSVVTKHIKTSSNLLCPYDTHKSSANLKTCEAAVWEASDHVVPTLRTSSCVPYLCALSEFVEICDNKEIKLLFLQHENLNEYFSLLRQMNKYNLTSNWFTRMESLLIMNVLKIAIPIQQHIDTSVFYELAVKSLSIFNCDQKPDVEFILTNIVFSIKFYPSEVLMDTLNISENDVLKTSLGYLNEVCEVYSRVLGLKSNIIDFTLTLSVDIKIGNIMPIDWIYSPIIMLYSNQQDRKLGMSEDEQVMIVINCLRWIYIYETYFPVLAEMINPTDRFCRLACVFLGSDSLFLNQEICALLEACFKHIVLSNENRINFNKTIEGLSNFQDFYTQLLEQYQGVSYGNILFGNLILLPLAQRYDVKYRKTLWSEYAGIIQVFNVTSEQLLCPMEYFLDPPETDISLLKCYRRALVMNLIRKNSVLYQIAKFHVESFVQRERT